MDLPHNAHTAGAAFRLVRATEQLTTAVAVLIQLDSYSGEGGEGTVAKINSPNSCCNPLCPTLGASLQVFSHLRLGL